MWPHRRQPTRLPRPWDSPGKNTGVGCHFLLQCMKVKSESEVVQLCPTLHDPMDCSLPGSSVHGIFQARVLEWGAIAFSVRRHSPACLLYLQGWHNLTYLVSIIDSKYNYMFITAILLRPLKLVGQYHLRWQIQQFTIFYFYNLSVNGQSKPKWTNGLLLLEILGLNFGEKEPKDIWLEQEV